MYTKDSVSYYDRIYAAQGKDYRKEADYLLQTLKSHGVQTGGSLLDVACGTGSHLLHLQPLFDVEGVDLSLDFVRIARSKLPKTKFYVGDMCSFVTGKRYDVVTCLFSSIGYMDTPVRLRSAIRNMTKHLNEGGLLIIEPWFSPGQMQDGRTTVTVLDEEKLKIARMATTRVRERISTFEFHFLVGTPSGTEHFTEDHRLALYSQDEMMEAFGKAGLSAEFDKKGPTGRGLYIAQRTKHT